MLRGARDVRNLVCIDSVGGGGWASHGAAGDIVLEQRQSRLSRRSGRRAHSERLDVGDYVERHPEPRPAPATPGWAPTYQFAGGNGFKFAPPPPRDEDKPRGPRASTRNARRLIEAARQPAARKTPIWSLSSSDRCT